VNNQGQEAHPGKTPGRPEPAGGLVDRDSLNPVSLFLSVSLKRGERTPSAIKSIVLSPRLHRVLL
jgi:hypothetical protein